MIKKYKLNDFNKNVIKLMTGATLAQAIPVAISPILTRLYTPKDFGVLALFVAITSILGTIANARYELAIVLPEKDEESINIVALSIIISSSFSILLLILILFFHNQIVLLLGNQEISVWLYTVPLVVFFIGIFNALNYYNTRMQKFGVIAQVKVVKSITLSVVQIVFGLFKAGVGGLISGQIVSHIFANGKLAKNILKDRALLSKIQMKSIIRLGKKYKRFPLITLWASLSNSLSLHTTSIFISLLYSASSLGHYSLVQKILGLPTTLVGKSIGQVFLQKASQERNKTGTASSIYKSTFKKLLMVSLPIFGILFFVIEDAVVILFGDDWKVAGEYAKYLMPLFFLRFLAAPLSLITIIFEKQNIDFLWQLTMLVLTVLIFIIVYMFGLSIYSFLILYCGIIGLHYIIILLITFSIATKNRI